MHIKDILIALNFTCIALLLSTLLIYLSLFIFFHFVSSSFHLPTCLPYTFLHTFHTSITLLVFSALLPHSLQFPPPPLLHLFSCSLTLSSVPSNIVYMSRHNVWSTLNLTRCYLFLTRHFRTECYVFHNIQKDL